MVDHFLNQKTSMDSVELWEFFEHDTKLAKKLWIKRSKIGKTAKSPNFAQIRYLYFSEFFSENFTKY